ncbi:hypothetical protein HF325_006855 [Metschnikowia pulcherrima]|uniref:Probable vacuolar protein sorting-associated protein 16 homolog n=1 Tax=Metschnikowia pulcherrima TaxID=27326 RepID=A0A8H7GJU9_9ASCO|nr:hypothetical protein HF325_006855 [Metschnikowia pulcherrima]
MSLLNPSLSWQQLQDVYYLIRTCYDELPWQLEDLYLNHKVALSANTTLLALASKFVPHPNVVTIYSLSGQKVWTLVYNSTGTLDHIVDFAFYGENLCVVLANSKIRVYTDLSGTFDEFSCVADMVQINAANEAQNGAKFDKNAYRAVITNLEDGLTEEPRVVLAAAVWSRYLVLRYSDHVTFMDLLDYTNFEVPLPGLDPAKTHAWCLVAATDTQLRWLLGYDQTIYSVQCDFLENTYTFTNEQLTDGPFEKMLCSANGKLVLLLNAKTGRIFTQIDGLTIITRNKIEFLSRVPVASVNVFLVGSTHAAAVLLDCVEQLSHHASKADLNISLLTAEGLLVDAIDGCLHAALEEFLPDLQKALMKAASFGKVYVENGYNADKYLRVLNTLKVFNQLRLPEVGLFLTNLQASEIGWPTIIEMLLSRSLYVLALSIVEILDLKDCKPPIFVHWCCGKIRAERDLDDIELFRIVLKRLLAASDHKGPVRNYISAQPIFDVALQEGRLDLCKLLVNLEPLAPVKIKQLLRIDEVDLALIKCFQTCDYDSCVWMLRHLKKTLSAVEFQRVLNQNEMVEVINGGSIQELLKDEEIRHLFRENLFISGDLIGNFWLQLTAKHDKKLLEEYHKSKGQSAELNLLQLKSYQKRKFDYSDSLAYAEIYDRKKRNLTRLAQNKKVKQMVQLELDTLELRFRLSNTFQQSFFEEISVVDMVKRLIKMHQLKPAAKVIREFKLSQEMLWNLVLETYCQMGEFERLNKFISDASGNGTTLKSPIGFETIVETCLAYKCPPQYVSAYISQCLETAYPQKVEYYVRNGDMSLAAEEAYRNRDETLLRSVQRSLSSEDADVLDAIQTYLNKLGAT